MFDKFSDTLSRLAVTLNSNKYVATIRDSFINVIPFVIVGSIGTLLGSVVCSTSGLAQFSSFAFLLDYAPWFNTMNYATMNILALLIAFQIGKNLAKHFDGRDGTFEGLLSLICFVIVSPTTLTATFNNQSQVVANVLSSDVTSSKGLFVAMIIGLLSIHIFCRLSTIEKLKIKLPEQVPPNVSASFSSLVPTVIVALGVSGLAFLFEKVIGTNLSTYIFTMLQTPISAAFQYPIGIIVCVFFAALFWICGLHGASIVTGIIYPIIIPALQTNMDLFMANQVPTEIVTKPFWNMYATIGGFGCTFGLLIAIFIVGKRDDDKAIAKLSLAPALFGINEPVIFGIPIVMNPIMAIPFILCPVICTAIGYFATASGIAAKAVSDIPWCFPPLLNGFIATGGDIMTVLVQAFCIVVTIFIWIPFVRIRNKELQKESLEN